MAATISGCASHRRRRSVPRLGPPSRGCTASSALSRVGGRPAGPISAAGVRAQAVDGDGGAAPAIGRVRSVSRVRIL